jgi:hypothetical protein
MENGKVFKFFRYLGIVSGAIIASATVVGAVTLFIWNVATAPIVRAIERERDSRVNTDTLVIQQLRSVALSINALQTELMVHEASTMRSFKKAQRQP